MKLSIPYIKALGLMVSDNKIGSCFSLYISLCKTCDRLASNFWLKGHNLNKLRPLGDATYQISRL